MLDWDHIVGAVSVAGGVYSFLYGTGRLPRTEGDPEAWALWRRKFGPMMKYLGPFLVAYGSLLLIGIL